MLLASFMGGMCAGSILFPRVLPPSTHPLRSYALIEAGIGVFAVGVLWVAPMVNNPAAAAVCLLPPTLLMGATLPALARPSDEGSLGWLYAANIAGAVLGCLLAGFYLLRKYDVSVATYAGLAINAALATLALALSRPQSVPPSSSEPQPAPLPNAVYFAIALSGFCALAAEAVWTRLLSLLFGASVYAFSIILAVFLTGLGIGSGIGTVLCRIVESPRQALGSCQWLAAAAIAWTAYNLSASLPYWPINPAIPTDIRSHFALDLARGFWALLPVTVLWGASFPLALAAASSKENDTGRLMAVIYAANTLGAILGALAASLLLVGWVGSQRVQQLLLVLSVLAGLPLLRSKRWLAIPAALLLFCVPPVPGLLIAYGRYAATWVGKSEILYAREGINSSVAVARFPGGALTFHVAGKIQASNVPRDMRLQRMLGHLTTLAARNPRSVLVIGCGAGITAGAVSIDPRVERETIVEIEPLVPQAAAAYFSEPNFDVLHNPKVQVRIADGRHYLLTTRERFDGITIDPLDPWVKGAANLYTEEFLENLRQHLNPGGVVTVYIQLFETDLAAVKSSLATFFRVFPNGTIWGNPYRGQGHDMVLLGTVEPLRIDLDALEQFRAATAGEGSRLSQSLAEIGMNSPVDLFGTYAGRASDLKPWLRSAPINRDRNLRMQYLAGLGLDRDDAAPIYAEMLRYRRFPEDLFISKEGRVELLRARVAGPRLSDNPADSETGH